MFSRIMVDWLHCIKTTEVWPNTRDEVYFIINGGTKSGPVNTYVRPPPPEDYYGMDEGQTRNQIILWEGHIPDNSFAAFNIVVRDQDNAQLPLIIGGIVGIAVGLAAALAPAVFDAASQLPGVKDAADSAMKGLINSLKSDADDIIGAYSLIVGNQNGRLTLTWQAAQGESAKTTLAIADSTSAQFRLAGDGEYDIRTSVQRAPLYVVRNKNSQKVLDVPYSSDASGVRIQQYTYHGHSNQRWFMRFNSVINVPVPPFFMPGVIFYNDKSGLVLDVEGASVANGAPVNQYPWHGGFNQRWGILRVSGTSDEVEIIGGQSSKVLDIPNGSHDDHALLQIIARNGGNNQRWLLQAMMEPSITDPWP